MTEREAVTILQEQFAGDAGFVAQLRRGHGLDQAGIAQARAAIDVLKREWAHRSHVPKSAVLPLVDIYTSIASSAHLYPETEDAIEDLAEEMRSRVEGIFLWWPGTMPEAVAEAIVVAQLSGMTSFVLDLHRRQGLRRDGLEELISALDTLRQAWEDRSDVPRTVVGKMLDARHAVWSNAGWYPELQAELAAIAGDLKKRVIQCLS